MKGDAILSGIVCGYTHKDYDLLLLSSNVNRRRERKGDKVGYSEDEVVERE